MYDFDSVIDRRNTGSYKWDVKKNELPMWVADMDFQTAPEILDAIKERADHGVFGYSMIPDKWSKAYKDWWKDNHDFSMEKEWLVFTTGVVPALSTAVRKLTTPGENVLIQTPVYNIFFNSILNNGRNVVENQLIYQNGKYHVDFEDLIEKLQDPQTTMMILCNPQNPAGNIWNKGTLERIGYLCAKYHVVVISDEIHCDITAPGKHYIPFASVSEECRENSITCIAPTKAFNIAGFQTAAVMVPNDNLRHKMWRALNTDEVAEPNVFAVDVAVAAFTKGKPWLDELRVYIQENKNIVKDFLEKEISKIHLVETDSTYLLWIHCGDITKNSDELTAFIRKETGLYVSGGSQFGGDGDQFFRMNVACPKETLMDGLYRLKEGVKEYLS